jgi:uncharacterized protein YutE (UPF0331/DUF86 family)
METGNTLTSNVLGATPKIKLRKDLSLREVDNGFIISYKSVDEEQPYHYTENIATSVEQVVEIVSNYLSK